jgi:putative transposase
MLDLMSEWVDANVGQAGLGASHAGSCRGGLTRSRYPGSAKSSRMLAGRTPNTLDTSFCIEALQEALSSFGTPEIFNTDQGAQFTSEAFTSVLRGRGVKISMDGKGRCLDNVFVERLWRSVKYEEVYLHAYANVAEARSGLARYFDFYNRERPHQALGYQTPDAFHRGLQQAA